jgi:hypothetical protein
MLHDFGGNRDLYGNLTHIATAPVDARAAPGSTMVGTGLTMEAIEQNPVVYELMSGTHIALLLPRHLAHQADLRANPQKWAGGPHTWMSTIGWIAM